MKVRGFDDVDTATRAVLSTLRERLGRDCCLAAENSQTVAPGLAFELLRSDGVRVDTLVVSGEGRPLSDADRSFVETAARLLATLVDAQHRATQARIDSETDPLTGLANRRGWQRRIESVESEPTNRYLVLVDLDDLKQVNDAEGHAAGDNLLRRAANTLQAWCGDGIAARIGGDEFAICVNDRQEQNPEAVAADLYNALREQGIHATIGCARYSAAAPSAEAWAEADRLLCDAKRRNRSP
jgi:diguanylate cyclase (GGDEF)-like protein